MTESETDLDREEDLRRLLQDAIEVQLAALKAGISFWTEWIEQTSAFVQTATTSLANISSEDAKTRDVLLELVDAGRASVRSMTEIPRNTANKFIEELDKLSAQQETKIPKGRKRAAGSKKSAPVRPRRTGKVKS
ncbi:MAG: hypothetical protein H7066_06075 [Cytophagaceae bacterium]|nr:hypothetical protein [Gemmatimonadaceae bacterium]